MNRFDRHVAFRLLYSFAGLCAVLIVFFIVLHYVEFIDDFLDRGATMRRVFGVYYPAYVPEIVKLISPLALFLACVYVTGKLAQTLQLSALQTNGVSLYRLLTPYLLIGCVVTGSMFWFNGWIVPRTNRVVLQFERQYLKDAPRVVDVNDIHRQNRLGAYLTIAYYDQHNRIAHQVSFQRFSETHVLTQRIDAPSMTWIDSLSLWRIRNPVIRTFTGPTETRRLATHVDTVLEIRPRDLARTERDVESMTIPAASQHIRNLERSGAGEMGRTKVGYHTKFAWPAANLILVLIAVPLSAVRRRGGQALRIGMGLLTAFLYLALQKLVEPFGYTGALPPAIAVWLPHLLFLAGAIILLIRVRK